MIFEFLGTFLIRSIENFFQSCFIFWESAQSSKVFKNMVQGCSTPLTVSKLGSKIKLDMFLIQMNTKKVQKLQAFAYRSNKKWILSIFIENACWVVVTPPYTLTLTSYPDPPECATPMVFASKWLQRMNLKLPKLLKIN